MFGLVVIDVVIGLSFLLSFLLPISADYFTNPPSFVTINGTPEETQDLSTKFTLGQTVQITWSTSIHSVSLTLTHWDVHKGASLASFLTNVENTGFYTWTIGTNDGIDEKQLAVSPNFAFQLKDPTGQTSTGNPPGFIDDLLTSRGFVIKSNITSSSSSTAGSSPTSSAPSTSTTASIVANSTPASGLSTAAKAGIGTGIGVGVVALVVALIFFLQRQRDLRLRRELQQQSQTEEANVADVVDGNQKQPYREPVELNTLPQCGELSGSSPLTELSAEPHR
ncbi:MAG: hypothetical protein M1839_008688 [Geoglossum umbratile]|nr:MAG: hypothetical protein M1839_008688 [Geoglossum umbratile]